MYEYICMFYVILTDDQSYVYAKAKQGLSINMILIIYICIIMVLRYLAQGYRLLCRLINYK